LSKKGKLSKKKENKMDPCGSLRVGSVEKDLQAARTVVTKARCYGKRPVVKSRTLQEISGELMTALTDLEAMLATNSCQRCDNVRAEVLALLKTARRTINSIERRLMTAEVVGYERQRYLN
jgi:hypothetical protein